MQKLAKLLVLNILFLIGMSFSLVAQDSAAIANSLSSFDEYHTRNIDSLHVEVDSLLEASKHIDNLFLLSRGNKVKGNLYRAGGDPDSAIYRFGLMMEYSEALNDSEEVANALGMIGIAYKNLGDYPKAMTYYERALEIGQLIESDYYRANALMNLAVLSMRLHNMDAAKEYFDLAAYYWPEDDAKGKMVLNINYGNYHARLMQDDEAKVLYNKALDLAIERNDAWRKSLIYNNLAELEMRAGNHQKAIGYFKDAQGLLDEMKSVQIGLYSNLGIGYTFQLMGDLDSSLYYIRKGQQSGIPEGNHNLHRDAALSLSWIFELRNELDSALFYAQEAQRLRDSMQVDHFASKLAELELDAKMKQKNRELALLRDFEESQKGEIQMRNIALGVLGLLFLLGALLSMRQRKMNLELRQQKAALLESKELIHSQNERLNKLNNVKDKVFSILSHDLRGPIGALRGLVEFWKEKTVQSEEEAAVFEELQLSLNTTSDTLDNVLHWAKGQIEGKADRTAEVVKVNAIVDNVVSLSQPIARQKGVTIRTEFKEGASICADPDHMNLILRNLLSNAIKFTPSGKEVVIEGSHKDNHLILSVIDQGVGMSQDQLDALKSHGMVKSTLGTNREKGTGLGLSLIEEFCAMNDISITFESSEGKGTTVLLKMELKA